MLCCKTFLSFSHAGCLLSSCLTRKKFKITTAQKRLSHTTQHTFKNSRAIAVKCVFKNSFHPSFSASDFDIKRPWINSEMTFLLKLRISKPEVSWSRMNFLYINV